MDTVRMEVKYIGSVAVDSGQLMVCDPCYINGERWSHIGFNPSKADDEGMYPFDYNGACGATLSEKHFGALKFDNDIAGAGVAFSSGYGDGIYPVYATLVHDEMWGTRIAKVEILMIDIEEE